jgi:hypothetical protein
VGREGGGKRGRKSVNSRFGLGKRDERTYSVSPEEDGDSLGGKAVLVRTAETGRE